MTNEQKLREALQRAATEIEFAIVFVGQHYEQRARNMSVFLSEVRDLLSLQPPTSDHHRAFRYWHGTMVGIGAPGFPISEEKLLELVRQSVSPQEGKADELLRLCNEYINAYCDPDSEIEDKQDKAYIIACAFKNYLSQLRVALQLLDELEKDVCSCGLKQGYGCTIHWHASKIREAIRVQNA